MQTRQAEELPSLEWLWVTSAIADQHISSRQSHAIRFEIDRTKALHEGVLSIYNENQE
jgi:hypothetical protein